MKTKIIATIGPSTQTKEVIEKMVQAGVNVFRLNMSHGTVGWNEKMVKLIQSTTNAEVLLDTKGPEIRTCHVEHDVHLAKGEELLIVDDSREQEEFDPQKCVPVTYDKIASIVKEGSQIIIDSGAVIVEVTKIEEGVVWTKTLRGGKVTSRRHVNLPGAYIDLPILTKWDEKNLVMGAKNDVDKIALSFTRNVEDIRIARKFLKKEGSKARIIAKIENQEALENIDAIIDEADEVMVARGDLGVEVMWYTIPQIEQDIINKCNEKNTPVIVATEMMASMKDNPRPTRAETMDVAIAVQVGANYVMLSDETTVGHYPVQTVKAMKQIAEYAENNK